MTIRVVLGEDSYLMREGIIRVLAEEDDVELVATCGDVQLRPGGCDTCVYLQRHHGHESTFS